MIINHGIKFKSILEQICKYCTYRVLLLEDVCMHVSADRLIKYLRFGNRFPTLKIDFRCNGFKFRLRWHQSFPGHAWIQINDWFAERCLISLSLSWELLLLNWIWNLGQFFVRLVTECFYEKKLCWQATCNWCNDESAFMGSDMNIWVQSAITNGIALSLMLLRIHNFSGMLGLLVIRTFTLSQTDFKPDA